MITYQEHTTHINQPSTHIIICLISHILTFDFWGKNSNTAILHQNFQLNKIVISRSRLFDGNAFCIRHYLNLKLLAYTLFLNDLLAGLFLHFQIILYPNCMSRMKFQIWFKNLLIPHHLHLHFHLLKNHPEYSIKYLTFIHLRKSLYRHIV